MEIFFLIVAREIYKYFLSVIIKKITNELDNLFVYYPKNKHLKIFFKNIKQKSSFRK